jgi:hypothetical protein
VNTRNLVFLWAIRKRRLQLAMVGDRASELTKRRILRLCCQGLDSRTLRLEVIVALREAINADAWCIATIDPATLMLTSGTSR